MRYFLFFCTLMIFPKSAFAEVRLAVLEFRGVDVSESVRRILSDRVRSGVLKVSKGQKIKGEELLIMTRENIDQVLKDMGKSSADCKGECEVELAKNIGADYVISGEVLKMDDLYILSIKLHETDRGNLLGSEDVETEKKRELLSGAQAAGAKIFQEGLDLIPSNQNGSSSSGFSNSGGFSSSNNGFGGGVKMNIQEKLKEKKCREFAQKEAKRQREERVDNEVERLQEEATKAWKNLKKDLVPCLELDLEDRGPCQEALEGWYGNAATLKVVLNSGAEKVETDCGVREEVFDTISRTVEVAELEAAKQMREKLKRKSAAGGGSVSGNGYDAVWIPSGSFRMGCTKGDSDCYDSEKPSHKVTLTKGFYMMTTEVTQGLYKDVMGSNPSSFSSCGANCPVERVNWYDAVRMANKLSERDGLGACYQIGSGEEPSVSWKNTDCTGWRLPTEAEWEYAARGGESYKYAGSKNIDEVGWYNSNSGSKTHPVGQKKANGYGLYDMSGNVYEWV